MKKELRNPGLIEFLTTISAPGGGGAYVEFPFDTEQLYGTKGRIPVKVLFEDAPYRGSMLRYGTEKHIIIVVKKIQEAIGKHAGDTIRVKVELDDQPREIIVPEDMKSMLDKNEIAWARFNKLSYTHQKEYVDWIEGAKRIETRQKRIEKMIIKFKETN